MLKRDSWHFLLHVSSQLPIDPILCLFLLFLNSMPLLRVSILHVFVHFFLTFCPQLTLFSLHFMRKALLLIGYPFYANLLFVTVCESNTKSINDVRQHGVPGLRTHGHLIAKKSINLLRANSWSLLLAFNLKDNLLLIQQIDQLLQHAWNSIFAKYGTDENKADDYRNSFYPTDSPFSTVSFPKLTLEDLHYVLSKKLKNNTATGLDGWRPSEIKQLPDCLLLALLDVYNLCEPKATFLLPSTIPILLLFLKDYRVLRLVFVLLQFFLSHSPIPYLR